MRSAVPSRLPGVSFLEPPRVTPPALPPLDVTAFVGFAERGPIDLPVPLDDVTHYTDVFGGELPLARDERGRTVSAYLSAAVRSFFANGGRRCYVGRVAGRDARAARFALPGVVAFDGLGFPRPALVDASSAGRWADSLRLATRLSVLPLPREAFEVRDTGLLWWAASDAFAVERGDVLRLTGASGSQWLVPVTDVRRPTSIGEPISLQAAGAFALAHVDASPPTVLGAVFRLGVDSRSPLDLTGFVYRDGDETVLELRGPSVTMLGGGDLLELELPDGGALFHLAELRQLWASSSLPEPQVEARGARLVRLPAAPLPVFSPTDLERVERLRFDLLLQTAQTRRLMVTDLSFSQGGSRFWGDVILLESSVAAEPPPLGGRNSHSASDRTVVSRPTGAHRLAGGARATAAARAFRALQQGRHLDGRERQSLDRVALSGLLAPLDDTAPNPSVGSPTQFAYLPLDVPTVLNEDEARGPVQTGDDDLSEYTAAPFLDDELRTVSIGSLLTDAWDQAYVRERRLRGLHSLLTVDEVALLAVPDAVHSPWVLATSPPTPEPDLPLPAAPLEEPCPNLISPFLPCDRPPTIESVEPAFGNADDRLGAELTATIRTAVVVTGIGFSASPLSVRFGGRTAADVVVESDTLLTCLAPLSGVAGPVDVAVTNRHGTSVLPDSFTYVAASTVPSLPGLLPLAAADRALANGPLLELHEAMLRICQARRDVVGLLSLPAHFERQDCLVWQDAFRNRLGLPPRGQASDLADLADLSFVAVHHPWLLLGDGTAPERVRLAPPDGAVAGMIAARERRRGVWVAPANVPLQAALTVVPDLSRDDWAALFEAQINVVRREVRDVRVMSAHTLSDEHELRQLSVRRLMILLRKAAIERGMDFVFESNHERFREGVAVMLRRLLRGLFERGAFAGATPERSYRVVTDAGVNPRQSVNQGRFVALIQVAPSQPAELITVTLTRSDEGALQVNEV